MFLGGPGVEPDRIHEERPPAEDWTLAVQLTSELGEWLPLEYMTEDGETEEIEPCYYAWDRSGWGAAWIFVSPDGKEGRFLWDRV